jgi:hypothetical protein
MTPLNLEINFHTVILYGSLFWKLVETDSAMGLFEKALYMDRNTPGISIDGFLNVRIRLLS